MVQKKKNTVQSLNRIATIILLSIVSLAAVNAGTNFDEYHLDGKSFEGKIYWDKPLIRWLRFTDTIEFKDGTVSSKLSLKSGYKPSQYHIEKSNGTLIFSARAVRGEMDYYDWSGIFDGKSLRDVKMIWTNDGAVRHFVFDQK